MEPTIANTTDALKVIITPHDSNQVYNTIHPKLFLVATKNPATCYWRTGKNHHALKLGLVVGMTFETAYALVTKPKTKTPEPVSAKTLLNAKVKEFKIYLNLNLNANSLGKSTYDKVLKVFKATFKQAMFLQLSDFQAQKLTPEQLQILSIYTFNYNHIQNYNAFIKWFSSFLKETAPKLDITALKLNHEQKNNRPNFFNEFEKVSPALDCRPQWFETLIILSLLTLTPITGVKKITTADLKQLIKQEKNKTIKSYLKTCLVRCNRFKSLYACFKEEKPQNPLTDASIKKQFVPFAFDVFNSPFAIAKFCNHWRLFLKLADNDNRTTRNEKIKNGKNKLAQLLT